MNDYRSPVNSELTDEAKDWLKKQFDYLRLRDERIKREKEELRLWLSKREARSICDEPTASQSQAE